MALLITIVLLTWAVKLIMVKGTLSQGPTWAWSGLLLAFRRANLAVQGALPSDRLHWISAMTNIISNDRLIEKY